MTTSTFEIGSGARKHRRMAALTGAVLGALLSGGLDVARAAPASDDVPSMVVSYGDLDLSTDQGAQTLYRRIVAAARAVCPDPDPRQLSAFLQAKACRDQAIEHAVADIHSPKLAQARAARTRHG